MLVSKDRVQLRMPVEQWVKQALATPGISLAGLPVEAALEASTLPGSFHADPADRLLVATARHYGAALATADEAIQQYSRSKYCTVVAC